MSEAVFIDLLQQTVWLIILLSAPLLLVNLMVGIAISIFQAVTQIQESTLTFVPKILASFLVLVLTGPWMTQMIVQYTNQVFTQLAALSKPEK
ncbi:MAG TPA: flagellar biosynthesis protein FliQ [Oculatellaceae cyanobacterium]|jgi:flagellar biosynthetic protein FliQ